MTKCHKRKAHNCSIEATAGHTAYRLNNTTRAAEDLTPKERAAVLEHTNEYSRKRGTNNQKLAGIRKQQA